MSPTDPAVVDTNVFGAALVPNSPIVESYRHLLEGRPLLLSFQTVAELRFGALRRMWGDTRMRQLERRIAEAAVVWADRPLVEAYAQLRVDCERVGHALGQRAHDADRWIAATAMRLGVPLISHDGVFRDAPGLNLETQLS